MRRSSSCGDGEQAERVVLAQVVLDGERRLRQLERALRGSARRRDARRASAAGARAGAPRARRAARSIAALMGAPVLLEVADQRRAEVADGLLAAVDRHVLAEGRRAAPGRSRSARRLATPLTAPALSRSARACARSPRPSRPARRSRRPAPRAASSRPERIAWRARRSPTKRGSRRFAAPGMMPSLRAGQRAAAALPRRRMWSTVSSSWQPPPIANVSAAAIHSFSTSGCAEAAEDLVHEAEVADREEQVGDLAAVEVREVQAGAEDAPAGVARVLDDAAAQHARSRSASSSSSEVDRRPRTGRSWCRPRR